MKYKILNLYKGEESLPLLLEYMNYVNEKRSKNSNTSPGTYTISTFMSSLRFSTIYAKTADDVLPYIVDGPWFVCATKDKDETIISDTLNFLENHPNYSKLKKLTPEDEFTGKYLTCPRLIMDGMSYVEA